MPLALSPLTHSSWVAGLLLVGLGVVSMAIGLLGLYPDLKPQTPGLAIAGSFAAAIAGVAAAAHVGLGVIAFGWIWVFGDPPGVPMGLYLVIASLMALGYAIGFLLYGLGGSVSAALIASTRWSLLIGGLILLVTAVGAFLRTGIGIGPPSWTVFPAIVITGVATFGTGVSIRPPESPSEESER